MRSTTSAGRGRRSRALAARRVRARRPRRAAPARRGSDQLPRSRDPPRRGDRDRTVLRARAPDLERRPVDVRRRRRHRGRDADVEAPRRRRPVPRARSARRGTGEFVVASSGEHDLGLAPGVRPRLIANDWYANDPAAARAPFHRPGGPATLVGFTQPDTGYPPDRRGGRVHGKGWPGVGTPYAAFRFGRGPAAEAWTAGAARA